MEPREIPIMVLQFTGDMVRRLKARYVLRIRLASRVRECETVERAS